MYADRIEWTNKMEIGRKLRYEDMLTYQVSYAFCECTVQLTSPYRLLEIGGGGEGKS
jgi:hypothetical protein